MFRIGIRRLFVLLLVISFVFITNFFIISSKPINLGDVNGELESIKVKDAYQGEPVKISAKIKNEGSLRFQATLNIVIKSSKGEEVFKNEKQVNINPESEETIDCEWPTKEAKVGEYTADYKLSMGDKIISDNLNFKVLGSYKLHVGIVCILIILLILFVMLAKRKKINIEELY